MNQQGTIESKLEKNYSSAIPEYLELYLDNEIGDVKKETDSDGKHRSDKQFWEEEKFELAKKTLWGIKGFKEKSRNAEKVEQERDLSKDEIDMLIGICEHDMYLFAIRYFSHYLKKPSSPLHKYLYEYMNKNLGKQDRKKGFKHALAAPRGGAKSALVSAILPLWCIAYNKKRFIIITSDTIGQAEDFLADIKRELELNDLLKRDFPYLATKGPVWRTDEIITKNDIKVKVLGTGSKIRGRRFGIYRPDLVLCHEEGTKILHNDEWIKVEDHPSFKKSFMSDGYRIKLWGVWDSETVSEDHRYFVKSIEIKTPNWVEAYKLNNSSYIGYKIDTEVVDPQPVNSKIPTEFSDKEFWWFIGLWWRKGYSSGKYLTTITVANNDISVFNKLKTVLDRHNQKFIIQKGKYYSQVKVFRQWLSGLTYGWQVNDSEKLPPYWVEKLNTTYQKELIEGYIVADGLSDEKQKDVKLSSAGYNELLSIRRILMRLRIPSLIRNTYYDLRYKKGVYLLVYDIENKSYLHLTHISDGYLWNKVKTIDRVYNRKFIPIKTDTGSYLTDFGLSHNCDDLESSDMVRSRSMREFVRYEWFNKDLLYVGGEEGAPCDILVVGTVLGKDSLLNALLSPNEYPDWTSKKFKSVLKFSSSNLWNEWGDLYKNRFDPDRIETAYNFFLDHTDEMLEGTEVLWPEGESYYQLMIYRLSNPSGFNSEKQNSVVDVSKILVTFKQLHFEDFSTDEAIQRILLSPKSSWYGFIDPSLGKHANRGDFSCITTVCRDIKTGYLFVVDFDIKRRKVDDQIDAILDNHSKFGYKLFGVETNAFQLVVADNLRKKSRSRGYYVPIKDVIQSKDKKMRVEGIVPLLIDGTIVFDSNKYNNSQQYNIAVDQITSFTGEGDAHDDAPDCLTSCVNIAKKKIFRLITKRTR